MAKKKASLPATRSGRAPTKRQRASIYSHPEELPPEFCRVIERIEGLVGGPMWLLLQNDPPDDRYDAITFDVYKGFQKAMSANPGPMQSLLIESPGGEPNFAFRIAKLFQR